MITIYIWRWDIDESGGDYKEEPEIIECDWFEIYIYRKFNEYIYYKGQNEKRIELRDPDIVRIGYRGEKPE